MKKLELWLIFTVMAVAAVALMMGSSDGSYADGGSCGEQLTWDYDGNGKLTIEGFGKMDDWNSPEEVPWHAYRSQITTIQMANGLASLGNYCYQDCRITSMDLITNGNVASMGKDCLKNCNQLTYLAIGPNISDFTAEKVYGCYNLTHIDVMGMYNYTTDEQRMVFTADKKAVVYYPAGRDIDGVIIPAGVEKVCAYAFADARVHSISVPDTVKVFEDRAFYNCAGNMSVTFGPDTEYIGSELWGVDRPAKMYFHLDFKGTLKKDFCTWDFLNDDGSKCTDLPKDLLGREFVANEDGGFTVSRAALSIRYQFADGSEAGDRIYYLLVGGIHYHCGTPPLDGYKASMDEVSGTTSLKVTDVTVVYGNKQFPVVYYIDGKEVMRSTEYYGFTVDVKPYEKGSMTASDWFTLDADIENSKFVMPDKQVNMTNMVTEGLVPEQQNKEDAPESMATGLAIAVAVIAAAMLLLAIRRHRS